MCLWPARGLLGNSPSDVTLALAPNCLGHRNHCADAAVAPSSLRRDQSGEQRAKRLRLRSIASSAQATAFAMCSCARRHCDANFNVNNRIDTVGLSPRQPAVESSRNEQGRPEGGPDNVLSKLRLKAVGYPGPPPLTSTAFPWNDSYRAAVSIL
jgi:hypothetical protein